MQPIQAIREQTASLPVDTNTHTHTHPPPGSISSRLMCGAVCRTRQGIKSNTPYTAETKLSLLPARARVGGKTDQSEAEVLFGGDGFQQRRLLSGQSSLPHCGPLLKLLINLTDLETVSTKTSGTCGASWKHRHKAVTCRSDLSSFLFQQLTSNSLNQI